jgi:hypothetical protein
VSPFDRRRLQTLQREVRPLVGRDITLPAGPGLERDTEGQLLLRALGTGSVGPFERAAFVDRLHVLVSAGRGRS